LYHHLARDHLDRIPLSIREALRARYYLLAARNLEGTTQALRVLDALETAGTPAVAWKGPILAHSVYPGPELRIFNDLDILIRRQDVGTVRGVLEARGYQRVFGPDIPDDDLFSRN